MHHLDANKTAGEETRRQLHKNVASNIEQVLAATPPKHQLYGHLPPIMKTIQVRWTRHTGHRWRSRDELISDVLLWTPTYGRAKAGRPARTYIQQLCEDMGCSLEDLPEAMNNREKWQERVKDIRASSTTWWLWWWGVNINLKLFPPKSSTICFAHDSCFNGAYRDSYTSPVMNHTFMISRLTWIVETQIINKEQTLSNNPNLILFVDLVLHALPKPERNNNVFYGFQFSLLYPFLQLLNN